MQVHWSVFLIIQLFCCLIFIKKKIAWSGTITKDQARCVGSKLINNIHRQVHLAKFNECICVVSYAQKKPILEHFSDLSATDQ